MKIRYLVYCIIFFTVLSCSKDNGDNCNNPIDCLPKVTEVGANTAGCLVDGRVLIPAGAGFGKGSVLKAQYVNYGGDLLFGIVIRDLTTDRGLLLDIRSDTIEEGKTYALDLVSDTTNYGTYSEKNFGFFQTNEMEVGEMYISKLDLYRRIASGTFWFTAQDKRTGKTVNVREGRFDVIFF